MNQHSKPRRWIRATISAAMFVLVWWLFVLVGWVDNHFTLVGAGLVYFVGVISGAEAWPTIEDARRVMRRNGTPSEQ